MTTRVTVERTEDGYVARNERGAEIRFSGVDEAEFTPVELLLAALGGCNLVTVEPLTAKRGHRLPTLKAVVESEKEPPARLTSITLMYDVEMPDGDDEARPVFEKVAERVHERYCTVSRALRESVPVTVNT